MNKELLNEIRARVSRKYLGKEGIHGVGVRVKQNAIFVYLEAAYNSKQEKLLEEIKKEVAPYKLLTIKEDRPILRISNPDD